VLAAPLCVTHSGLLLGLFASADTDTHAAFCAEPEKVTPPTVEMPAAGTEVGSSDTVCVQVKEPCMHSAVGFNQGHSCMLSCPSSCNCVGACCPVLRTTRQAGKRTSAVSS
jgi:hypothetical protein